LAHSGSQASPTPRRCCSGRSAASLDAITEAALFERYLAVRKLARRSGAITLLVSHRFCTVRMADLIVVLNQGGIIASGDHTSLIREGGLYAELYEMQARAYR
jgi:ATP-binding cassette, subfamily B, bacterial